MNQIHTIDLRADAALRDAAGGPTGASATAENATPLELCLGNAKVRSRLLDSPNTVEPVTRRAFPLRASRPVRAAACEDGRMTGAHAGETISVRDPTSRILDGFDAMAYVRECVR